MEDYLEVLVFLAFAAFSLFTQFLNKRKKAVTRAPEDKMRRDFEQEPTDDPPVTAHPRRRRVRPSPPQHTPTSLEDILRELTGQPAEVDIEDEEDDYELPPYLQEKQEEAKQEIGAPPPPELLRRTPPPPKKLADKISLEDDGKRIKPFKTSVKQRKTSMGALVAQSLRHPEGARRAVILSEILQRKHF